MWVTCVKRQREKEPTASNSTELQNAPNRERGFAPLHTPPQGRAERGLTSGVALRDSSLHSLSLELLSLSESDSELLSDSLELPEPPLEWAKPVACATGTDRLLWGQEPPLVCSWLSASQWSPFTSNVLSVTSLTCSADPQLQGQPNGCATMEPPEELVSDSWDTLIMLIHYHHHHPPVRNASVSQAPAY